MYIRLGYVAIALGLPNVTSSSHLTFTRYQKLISEEEKINQLKKVTLSNLNDLYTILKYNIEHQVHFYRITSRLVPLATHPEVKDWRYRTFFKEDFKRIGELVKSHGMRVDTHPDQFNVLNSTREEVVEATIRDLMYHHALFEDMDYPLGKMVLHIGSTQGGKEKAMERFIENFNKAPKEIRDKLILENDDKSFTAKDVLSICKEVKAPMVLDIHHHLCNNEGEEPDLEAIFSTWEGTNLPPKIHLSSPKEGPKDRRHADYINPMDFIQFAEKVKEFNIDIDVMLESKKKDLSLFALVKDIKALKPEWQWADQTTLEI
ncbi:MAG: damage endonuclease UvsE [Defluviitaleaceae bacterium]|jgi:UV DNA damage endonuclease|uniref:UV DNA damage repair endonuclease UvsE n=1 Tax=Defluviitalea raffinosedens TaxID=1450156 RepID=A0A7C8LHU5_9FIRM|nr:UV DNA damage repair endonuclease UvsE [Defluviitalea raffinosedens]KAE9628750.1 UV DNA damage repair endonuclease UvsE [Defluviitalea raffinosedens]MBZ4667694.1 damage endonuclease UvsE [Defluviitaleaceae bacterium]HHW66119.1 UV DNA damage repair endonuclease UvsE [Candidatus Epulonipiscium sp.]